MEKWQIVFCVAGSAGLYVYLKVLVWFFLNIFR